MFLLNYIKGVNIYDNIAFTIQNVSIKLKTGDRNVEGLINLQYKMFLLNLLLVKLSYLQLLNLQYKMFLLNLVFLKLPI